MSSVSVNKDLAQPQVQNDWEIEQQNKRQYMLVASMVALSVLVAFGAIYHEAVFSFLKSHITFSTIMLPSITAGLIVSLVIDKLEKSNQKKLIVLAILTFAAIVASWAAISNYHDLKLISLCFGGAVVLYYMFNAKEPYPELIDKSGNKLIDPTSKFSYGNILTADYEEVHVELRNVYFKERDDRFNIGDIIDDKFMVTKAFSDADGRGYNGLEVRCIEVKETEALPALNEVVEFAKAEARGVPFYGKVVKLNQSQHKFYVVEHKKGIFSRSQRRALENGHHLYPVFLKDPVDKKSNIASYVWLAMILKSVVAGVLDLLAIPFYIAYLALRFPYDLYKSQDGWELLGNRFFEILDVPGEGIESAATNALCSVASLFGCAAMYFEGFAHGRPMISQKILSKIEQVQNQVPLYSCYWILAIDQCKKQYHFNARADLLITKDQKIRLKFYGAYILGCCQPHDAVEIDPSGKVVKWTNLQRPDLEYHIISTQPRPLDLNSKEGWSTAPIKSFRGKQK